MNKKDPILLELYEVLEELQYPEIVKLRFEDFENIILSGNKRLDLLLWVIQESPAFNSTILSKLKDNGLNEKLCKCFSQIGLCNDENILLGNCTTDKQLHFLSLLTLYIKSTHLENTSPKKNKKIDIENICLDLTPKHSNIDKKEHFTTVPSSAVPQILIDNHLTKYSIDDLCLNVKANIKQLNDLKTDTYKLIIQKFKTSFKNLMSLKNDNENTDVLFKNYEGLVTDIQKIHSTFRAFNNAVINEIKISNTSIPENSTKNISPLTQAIRSNLLSIEQACNILNENKHFNQLLLK